MSSDCRSRLASRAAHTIEGAVLLAPYDRWKTARRYGPRPKSARDQPGAGRAAGIDDEKLRVITPERGGGFGAKSDSIRKRWWWRSRQQQGRR